MTAPSPPSVNDLRIRVLEGEDISPDEMLMIVNDIRQSRRSAARAAPAPSARRTKAADKPITTEDLRTILDQDI